MYSRNHLLISLIIGLISASFFGITGLEFALIVGYGCVIGVLIDIDHFVIARINTGTWSALRASLARPSKLLFQQRTVFTGEVGKLQRLLSHMIISGVIVSIIAVFNIILSLFSIIIFYFHIVGDIYADIREIQPPL
jgi:hypothetical protein